MVDKTHSQIEVGKRFEKMLRSRGSGRDDNAIRAELEFAVQELDKEFSPPSLEHCEALERLMRAYVRTKQHDKACEAAGRAVQYLREMNHTAGDFYYEALTAWVEKLLHVKDVETIEELFRAEIPKTKTWNAKSAHSLYRFLYTQVSYYRLQGDFAAAATAFSRVKELGIAAWGATHSQYWAISMGYVSVLIEAEAFSEAVAEWEKTISEARRNDVVPEWVLHESQKSLDEMKSQLQE